MSASRTGRPALRDRERVAWIGDRGLTIALLVGTALMVLAPLLAIFRESLGSGAAAAQRVLRTDDWPSVLVTTIVLAVGSLALALVLGTALAWCAHRLPPGRRWMSLIPIATLFVPGVALVTGWAFLLSPKIGYLNALLREVIPVDEGPFDVYTMPWIVILSGFSATAFVYLFVRSALAQLHQELIDAAAVAGSRSLRTLWSVVLPLIRPALIYGGATTLLLGIGQVTKPLILGRQEGIRVLSTEMYSYSSRSPIDYGAAATFGLPIVGIGLLLLVAQRVLLGDQSKYVTSGSRGARPLTRTKLPGQLLLLAFGAVAIVLPLLAIAYVSFSRFWTSEMSFDGLTLDPYRQVLEDTNLYNSIRNSVMYSLLAVAVTLPLSHLCARVIYHRSRRRVVSGLQEAVVSLPLGIPGVIFGMGFLVAYTSEPFLSLNLYGTPRSMVLVYITLMLPFATRMQLTAMTNIGPDLSSAGAVNGAGWLRRMCFIDLPLLRPAIGAAAALMIALIAQEFSASLMVRSVNTQVLSTALYDMWAYGSYPQVAVLAIVMCVITCLGVGLAFLLGGRSTLEGIGGRAGG